MNKSASSVTTNISENAFSLEFYSKYLMRNISQLCNVAAWVIFVKLL